MLSITPMKRYVTDHFDRNKGFISSSSSNRFEILLKNIPDFGGSHGALVINWRLRCEIQNEAGTTMSLYGGLGQTIECTKELGIERLGRDEVLE